eukprot:scaffold268701_cov102-Attheya_sp.AAC.1
MEEDEKEEGYGDLTEDVVGDGTQKAGNSVGYRNQHLHESYDATRHGQESIDCHFVEPPANDTAVKADVDFSTFRRALVEHYAYVTKLNPRSSIRIYRFGLFHRICMNKSTLVQKRSQTE